MTEGFAERLLHLAGGETRPDAVVEERPVRLVINGIEAALLMATPGGERELALGYALTMGWAHPGRRGMEAVWDPGAGEARLETAPEDRAAPPPAGARGSGGGHLGPGEIDPVGGDFCLPRSRIWEMAGEMARSQELYRRTGGSHAVALFDREGIILALAEDVGRHSALDKAVGLAWLAGGLERAGGAVLSGRAGLEMVQKAARAGLAVLAGVGAPTAQGVDRARELGLTLLGFVRPGRANLYTHPERVGGD